jgi:hypothetical protein
MEQKLSKIKDSNENILVINIILNACFPCFRFILEFNLMANIFWFFFAYLTISTILIVKRSLEFVNYRLLFTSSYRSKFIKLLLSYFPLVIFSFLFPEMTYIDRTAIFVFIVLLTLKEIHSLAYLLKK